MNPIQIQAAVEEFKQSVYAAVTTSSYKGKPYATGLEAKASLIKSSTLIQNIHELTKLSLQAELQLRNIGHQIHPPLGENKPELDVWGRLKKKKQDIVVLIGDKMPHPIEIEDGPLRGSTDELGLEATKNSIVVGIRSQLSSVNKNFDTLMERAIAEAINLRLRHPYLVMGEVYLLAVKEYDEQAMKLNQIKWKKKFTDVEKFISMFNAISNRSNHSDSDESFKYERSVLLLVDFSKSPAKVYTTEVDPRVRPVDGQTKR